MLQRIVIDADDPIDLPILGAGARATQVEIHQNGSKTQYKNLFICQKVTGLGPPDLSLFIGEYARDGGLYTGRRALTRNPVLTISPNPAYFSLEKDVNNVSALRQRLYRAFMDPLLTHDELMIHLIDSDRPERFIKGYTEKIEGEIFDQDTTLTISVVCPDPYIYDTTFMELPTENVSTMNGLSYPGTSEVGFEAIMVVSVQSEDPVKLTIRQDNVPSDMTLTRTGGFPVNSQIYINTIPGQRAITLKRTQDTGSGFDDDKPWLWTNILYTLDDKSDWIKLHASEFDLKGTNISRFTMFRYRPAYWGL